MIDGGGSPAQTVTVTYSPVARVASTCTMTLADDDPGTDSWTVSGTGASPNLGVSSGTVAFGNRHIGQSHQLTFTVTNQSPGNETLSFPRATTELPKEAVEIKPHPHGVELGALMLMAQESKSRDVGGFLQSAFSRVSSAAAGTPSSTSCTSG